MRETFPEPRKILKLFDELTDDGTLAKALRSPGPAFCRRRIYTLTVVIRLMVLQRLFGETTLASAVQLFRCGRDGTQGTTAKRQISMGASAYCRARKKMPTLVARQVLEQICQRLYGWLRKNPVLQGRTVYVCDGSTLRLPHSPELAKFYPPHSNQGGGSHWPFLRIVVLQDVETGLAMVPQWGKETESEQSLAVHAIAALPAGAVVIGDRNLGIFGVAFAASRCAHDVIVRLTKVRAERLAGRGIEPGYDRNLTWRPSRWDQCGGPYTADASVSGRLICIPAADPNHTEAIYLFTTLEIPVNQISNLYAQRWNVETDLRSIKQTVRLQEFSARSVTGLHNELLLAFAAYNLVRAMMCLAAAKANVPPRKISFTNVYTLLRNFAGDIYAHRHADAAHPFWKEMIDMAAYYKLPNRSKRPSYPRAVWSKGERFPAKRDP